MLYAIPVYIVAFLMQTILFGSLPFLNVSVNFVLCSMILLNSYLNSLTVYAGAIICGLLLDLCLGQFVGPLAIAYFVVAICLYFTTNLVYKSHFFSAIYTALWATILFEFTYWGIMFMFAGNYSFVYMLVRLPGLMILNGTLCGFVKWIKG